MFPSTVVHFEIESAQPSLIADVVVVRDTPHLSMVKSGLTTLISRSAKAAVGPPGVERLQNFAQLKSGWDGAASNPISLKSIEVFSNFFADTGLCPDRAGVFMSAERNVVVNWPDAGGQLVELEFHSSGVDYFVERSGEEDTVLANSAAFRNLSTLIAEHAES